MRYISSFLKKGSSSFERLRIKNKHFSIVSNNCWGGFVYQHFGLRYETPFIGLFLFAPDYIRLLEDLKGNLGLSLNFIEADCSKYGHILKEWNAYDKYPIALLGQDIEVHFFHYKSKKEASEKWGRRLARMDYDRMLVKFSDRDLCDEGLIARFDSMRYKNKVCFVSKPYENLKSVIFVRECLGLPMIEDEWKYTKRYYNIYKVINNL